MNVIIPTSMRQHTGGVGIAQVEGKTIDEAILFLLDSHPELKPHLLDASGHLVSYVNVFVNDTNIRDLNDGNTTLNDTDEIVLVPALAGG